MASAKTPFTPAVARYPFPHSLKTRMHTITQPLYEQQPPLLLAFPYPSSDSTDCRNWLAMQSRLLRTALAQQDTTPQVHSSTLGNAWASVQTSPAPPPSPRSSSTTGAREYMGCVPRQYQACFRSGPVPCLLLPSSSAFFSFMIWSSPPLTHSLPFLFPPPFPPLLSFAAASSSTNTTSHTLLVG